MTYEVNLYCSHLIPHLQGQALQYIASWHLHLGFIVGGCGGGHAYCYVCGLSELCHKYVWLTHWKFNKCGRQKWKRWQHWL